MQQMRSVLENSLFGVCAKIGDQLNMPSRSIRLFFIYSSFLTLGSPIIIYLVLGFWMKMRRLVNGARNPVWDL
jgi:phage shock protein PspC (stress-responsive transcriptional regulator)